MFLTPHIYVEEVLNCWDYKITSMSAILVYTFHNRWVSVLFLTNNAAGTTLNNWLKSTTLKACLCLLYKVVRALLEIPKLSLLYICWPWTWKIAIWVWFEDCSLILHYKSNDYNFLFLFTEQCFANMTLEFIKIEEEIIKKLKNG